MLDELRELYQEVILDHGKRPRNLRHPEDASHHAHGYNAMCGDTITVHLKLSPENRIEDAAFEGKGCAISVASASMMTEILKGKTEAEAKHLFDSFHAMCTSSDADYAPDVEDEEAFERLQVLAGVRQFPVRVKCATLAWHTMVAAMKGEAEASSE